MAKFWHRYKEWTSTLKLMLAKFWDRYKKWIPPPKLMFWLVIIGLILYVPSLIPKEETEPIYVSPSKKLIRANLADYSFPLKIVNEMDQDYNDIALKNSIPVSYSNVRIMIVPKDETEVIRRYNNSFQIMMPAYGRPEDDMFVRYYFIESIYNREIKEYSVTVNTRGYDEDFFIEFEIINLSESPDLIEWFKAFGAKRR